MIDPVHSGLRAVPRPIPIRGNMKSILWVGAALLASHVSACSVYMEATRPTPVDLNDYQEGMTRDAVLERLGAPDSSALESNGMNCDFYKLYTKGYGAGGKIPIALAEGAADVFTLGLAEIVLTPTEGVTKNEKHPITMCYNGPKLARITGEGQPAISADANPPIPAASTSTSDVPPGTNPSAAAAIASDQPKTGSRPVPLIVANPAPTANSQTPAVIPAAAIVDPAGAPARARP